jgi:hypothetical protein
LSHSSQLRDPMSYNLSRTSLLTLSAIAALGSTCLAPVDASAFGFRGFGGGFSRPAAARPNTPTATASEQA